MRAQRRGRPAAFAACLVIGGCAALMACGASGAADTGDAVPEAPPPVARIEPCEWQGIPSVECGSITVPEDRARPGGRTIDIFFVRARALGEAARDPIFFFTGGPGSAASGSAAFLTREFAALRASRDLVFVDQRGTGRSHPLHCSAPADPATRLSPMFEPARAAACKAELEPAADLRFYTTAEAATDVEDLRRALGYGQLNLHGSSYGTRAAWAYAARHPGRARTMILWGPAPPGFHLPEPFARGLAVALEGVLAACEAEAACASRYPAIRARAARAFERLQRAPAPVTVRGEDGASHAGELTAGEFAEGVRYQLYYMDGTRRLPWLLARAADGDYSPLAQAAVEMRARLEDLSRGMYFTVTCTEDVAMIDGARAAAESSGTWLGDYRVRQQIEACRDWPRGDARWWGGPSGAGGASTPDGASSNAAASSGAAPAPAPTAAAPGAGPRPAPSPLQTPTLVQVGEFDPATPLEQARAGMALLPRGRLVVVPHGAHNFNGLGVDACLRAMNEALITSGSTAGIDTSCVASAKRQPFILR